MMLVRVSSRNVLGFFVVVESLLPSTATRALIRGPWALRISKVPLEKKLKVPPFRGPAFTSHVPTSSGGTLFQTKTFSTAHVPPPAMRRQRTPKAQCHSLNFLPFSWVGLGSVGIALSRFSLASLEESFMAVPDLTRRYGDLRECVSYCFRVYGYCVAIENT